MYIQRIGKIDGKYGSLEEFRREVVSPYLDSRTPSTLEIGPFIRPTLQKDEVHLKTLDYYDTDELRQHASKIGADPGAVINVDYVCKDESYCAVVNEVFDLVIAAHVAEHVVGFVKYFQTLRKLVKSGGYCMIVLPDKRYGFDKFRSDTTLAHLVFGYLHPDFPMRELYALETAMLYDRNYIKSDNIVKDRLNIEFLKQSLGGWHPGVHSHIFQFEDVAQKIFVPLCAMGLIDFDVVEVAMSHQLGEFVVILRAGRKLTDWNWVRGFYAVARDTISPNVG